MAGIGLTFVGSANNAVENSGIAIRAELTGPATLAVEFAAKGTEECRDCDIKGTLKCILRIALSCPAFLSPVDLHTGTHIVTVVSTPRFGRKYDVHDLEVTSSRTMPRHHREQVFASVVGLSQNHEICRQWTIQTDSKTN